LCFREQWGEDVFHLGSSSSLAPSLYDTVRHANTAAVVESLQAQLKIREGQDRLQRPCLIHGIKKIIWNGHGYRQSH
jgi:hypothetical protein